MLRFSMPALRASGNERVPLELLAAGEASTYGEATKVAAQKGVEGAFISPLTAAALSWRGGIVTRTAGVGMDGRAVITHEITPIGQELIASARPPRRETIGRVLGSLVAVVSSRP